MDNAKKSTLSTDKKLVKTLLYILAIKLFLVFVVLKVFFFPDFLNERFESDVQKSDYVGSRLTDERVRHNPNP